MRLKVRGVVPVLILACSLTHAAQEHHPGGGITVAEGSNLGSVNFPVSCSAEAQATFNTAVALLHSFQYLAAQKAFAEVAQQDPRCAMAYWGQAMSLYHQLWDFPSAQTLKEGREYIAKAEALGAQTAREKAYIAAAATFYQDNPKLDRKARSVPYSQAMGELYNHYADDGEAAAFYSLSLIVLPAHGEEELANRRRAIGILTKLFADQPNHPGAAHYIIHAADTPPLAQEGLDAARRYAKIAPDSPHALHMPSHIFTRLGLWQESIDSNLASAAAAAKAAQAHTAEAHYQIHAMDFLNYAYLQTGQVAKSQAVIDNLNNVPGAGAGEIGHNRFYWNARSLLELHHWTEAAAFEPPHEDVYQQQYAYWIRTLGAGHTHNARAARKAFKKYKEFSAKVRRQEHEQAYNSAAGPGMGEMEADAWVHFAEGKPDKLEQAVKLLERAAEREQAEGVDSLSVPAREMLGDLLIELHQPTQALAAYKAALADSPGRFDGLYGAAHAAQMAGNAEEARDYYAKLMRMCTPGADRPELREAQVPSAKN